MSSNKPQGFVESCFRYARRVSRRIQNPHSSKFLTSCKKVAHGVLIVSLPKSGTHLLNQLIRHLGFRIHPSYYVIHYGWQESSNRVQNTLTEVLEAIDWVKPGRYLLSHLRPLPEIRKAIQDTGVRVLFNLRDPRALLFSHVNHVMRTPDSKFHTFYSQALNSTEERLELAIRGAGSRKVDFPEYWLPNIRDYFQQFLAWRDVENVLTVRFEDLVGPRGGGSAEMQEKTIKAVLDYLGISYKYKDIRLLQERIFSEQSHTFFKGRIDSWRDAFTQKNRESFDEVAKDLLETLGYSK